MTFSEVYASGVSLLKKSKIDDAQFDCSCLFEKAFGVNHGERLLNGNKDADAEKTEYFFSLVKERAKHTPLQYILGEWDFYDLTFAVGPGVLIPRRETEKLCEIAFEYLDLKKSNSVIFDLCCGSGCIGLTVAAHYPNCRVVLADISDDALHYSKVNREKYGFDNVHILKYDICDGYDSTAFLSLTPDIILSNPPYIRNADIESLQPEVLREPITALDGGSDGLDFYRVLAEKWTGILKPDGIFAVETGENQTDCIADLLSDSLDDIKVIKDCCGTERFVKARKGGNNDV